MSLQEDAAYKSFAEHWHYERVLHPDRKNYESETVKEVAEFAFVAGFYQGSIYTTDVLGTALNGRRKYPWTSKSDSYVGITGFKTLSQIQQVNNFLDAFGGNRKVMYGVVSSERRLASPNSEGKASPSVLELPKLLAAVSQKHLPMIHYHTNNILQLPEELEAVFKDVYDSNICRAVQLNLAWPLPELIEKTLEKMPGLEIVLQIPATALIANNEDIIDLAIPYNGLIKYLLIDPSGGEGKDGDLERGSELLHLLDARLDQVRIGIAGGFSAINVAKRIQFISTELDFYSDTNICEFCVDAQAKLHTDGLLDVEKVKRYLTAAFTAFELE